MITIRNFDKDDIPVLKEHMFQNASEENIEGAIDEWNGFRYKGKYFEMFAVCSDGNVVGTVSLYQHNDFTVSSGPEIFLPYRKQGFATAAINLALEHAKKQGYTAAIAQIRKSNSPSLALHKKVGFQESYELLNKNGEEVYIYLKLL